MRERKELLHLVWTATQGSRKAVNKLIQNWDRET